MTLIDQNAQIRPATAGVTAGRQATQEGTGEFGRWMADTSGPDKRNEDLHESGDSGLGGGPSLTALAAPAPPGAPGPAGDEEMTAPPASPRFTSGTRETSKTHNAVPSRSGMAEPSALSLQEGTAIDQTVGTPTDKWPAAASASASASPASADTSARTAQGAPPVAGNLSELPSGGTVSGRAPVERDGSAAQGVAGSVTMTLPGTARGPAAGRLDKDDLTKAEVPAASGDPRAEDGGRSGRTSDGPREPEPRVGSGAPAQAAERAVPVSPTGLPLSQADPATFARILLGEGGDPAVEMIRGMEPGQRSDDNRGAQLAQTRAGPVLPQIAEALVRRLAAEGAAVPGGEVEIRLDPPELGRIRIGFSGLDGALSGFVSAERGDVEALLRRHADVLERALADAGFANVSLQFGASSGGQDRGSDSLPAEESEPAAGRDVAMARARTTWGIGGGDGGRLDIRL